MNLLRELIFKNFGWKFLSVILASGIWLTIKTTSSEHGQTDRQFLNLQIQIVSGTADVRTY